MRARALHKARRAITANRVRRKRVRAAAKALIVPIRRIQKVAHDPQLRSLGREGRAVERRCGGHLAGREGGDGLRLVERETAPGVRDAPRGHRVSDLVEREQLQALGRQGVALRAPELAVPGPVAGAGDGVRAGVQVA